MHVTDMLIQISLSLPLALFQIRGIKCILKLFILKAKNCIAIKCVGISSPHTFLELFESLHTMKAKHEIFVTSTYLKENSK